MNPQRTPKRTKTAITGALSFTGRYLAQHLLQTGKTKSILNLSSRTHPISSHNLSPSTHSDNNNIHFHSHALTFDNPTHLQSLLEDVNVLYCTYWIRFERDGDTHRNAAERCRILFDCAKEAGVEKVVFAAHTGLSLDSPFSYIRGKAQAAQYLREISNSPNSKMKYAIVKPCGIFGENAMESILFNNAAYVLRRTPLFLLPHQGTAKFQPIHVHDMVQLLTSVGHDALQNTGEELDAVGPNAIPALTLFRTLRNVTNPYCTVVPSYLPPFVIGCMTKPLDWWTGDVLLDSNDLELMESGLTVADDPLDPRLESRKCVLDWLQDANLDLGKQYVNSVKRYYYNRN